MGRLLTVLLCAAFLWGPSMASGAAAAAQRKDPTSDIQREGPFLSVDNACPEVSGVAASAAGGSPQCRAALAFSGHLRSFSHPKVHQSVLRYLIEPIEEGGCQVDVFMYLSMEDEVPQQRLDTGHWNKFEPYTPAAEDVSPAIALLKPKAVQWHQEQAGLIPKSWGEEAPDADLMSAFSAAYWQLYKNLAVFRMVEKYEREHGFSYDWVMRSRLDLGWLSSIGPLSAFPSDRAYFGSSFWPLSDQFALLPRRLAEGYMAAVRSYYKCPDSYGQGDEGPIPWWKSKSGGVTEALLWEHLHGPSVTLTHTDPGGATHTRPSSLPFQYYDFHYVIVRFKEGGKCSTYLPYKLPMQLLKSYNRLHGDAAPGDMLVPVHLYYRKQCERVFPGPLDASEDAGAASDHGVDEGGGGGINGSDGAVSVESELVDLRVRVLESIASINVTSIRAQPADTSDASGASSPHHRRQLRVITSSGHNHDSMVGQVAVAYILTDAQVLELARALRCELWNIVYGPAATAGECSGSAARSFVDVWTGLWHDSQYAGTCEGSRCPFKRLTFPPDWMQYM